MPPRKIQKKSANKYMCASCGATFDTLTGNFYKSSANSVIWAGNEGYPPICKNCLDNYKVALVNKYKSEEWAMKVICHYMDWYYTPNIIVSISRNSRQYTAGMYSRLVNSNVQYKNKTFADSIFDGELFKSIEDDGNMDGVIRVPTFSPYEAKWDARDEKNRQYVIETYGYDPLEDIIEATISDKKFCYNALSGYCDTEGISEDGHKMMCCVSMVKTFLQIKKLDEEINKVSNDYEIDDTRLKNLMASKKQALDTITNLAKDNNISSQFNKNIRAGQGTMSDKIKEMYENGFEPSRVNLFDIKTCESIRQTANLSFQSIMEQLQLDENDYTRVIKTQREMVQDMSREIDRLKEENRQLSNEVLYLKNKEDEKD